MLLHNGFRYSLEEALLMRVASTYGLVELEAILMPGRQYLCLVPGPDSDEVRHITNIGYLEEWEKAVAAGGGPRLVTEAFFNSIEADLTEEDQAILDGTDCLMHGGTENRPLSFAENRVVVDGGVSDMPAAAERSLYQWEGE